MTYRADTNYYLEVGDHARVYRYMQVVKVIRVLERKRDIKPGNETPTPFYLGEDIRTGEVVWYWDEEVSKPISEMEVIAWATRLR